jgi:hypothetical protein
MIYDYCIIGGGIIGLSTAHKLLEINPSVGNARSRSNYYVKQDNFQVYQSFNIQGV